MFRAVLYTHSKRPYATMERGSNACTALGSFTETRAMGNATECPQQVEGLTMVRYNTYAVQEVRTTGMSMRCDRWSQLRVLFSSPFSYLHMRCGTLDACIWR